MNESEVLQEISRRTGLPESAAELILGSLRELVREGAVDGRALLGAADPEGAPPLPPDVPKMPEATYDDPTVVEEVIARARKHPLGLEFLLSGLLASVAIALGAHAFTVEAARARLRREKAAELQETTAS